MTAMPKIGGFRGVCDRSRSWRDRDILRVWRLTVGLSIQRFGHFGRIRVGHGVCGC